ncbi:MAG: winged helix-turn-helix domain-containing protein [Nitrososphaerales archaeon]
MKRRPNILIYMEILRLLLDAPNGPSRLSQATGLNFPKFMEFAAYLESKRLIRRETDGDHHDVFYITTEGAALRRDWEKVWGVLGPDVS